MGIIKTSTIYEPFKYYFRFISWIIFKYAIKRNSLWNFNIRIFRNAIRFILCEKSIPSIKDKNITINITNNIFKIVKSNTNLFIRTSLILISILMFTAIGSRLGNTILAANAILIMLQMFISYSLDGFAQAAEVLIGNEFSKKNKIKL